MNLVNAFETSIYSNLQNGPTRRGGKRARAAMTIFSQTFPSKRVYRQGAWYNPRPDRAAE
jgi:hypothetical protein